MKYMDGDLLELAEKGHFDIIVHGCNCFCNMGAGIARTIKEKYPEAFIADLDTDKGDRAKLGTYTKASVGNYNSFWIINAYTQYDFWSPGARADYDAIRAVFKEIHKEVRRYEEVLSYENETLRIGIPKIGAGLAGGDWNRIEKIIDSIGFSDITCVNYVPT